MKKILYNAGIIFTFLLGTPLLAMEKPIDEVDEQEWPCGMPAEMWATILSYVPLNPQAVESSRNIDSESEDIYKYIENIKPHVTNSLRAIFLTCQNFHGLKTSLISQLKNKYLGAFHPYATERFLIEKHNEKLENRLEVHPKMVLGLKEQII